MGEQSLHGGELTEGRGAFARFAYREEEEGQELYRIRVSDVSEKGERQRTEKTSLRTLSTRFSSPAPRGSA